MLFQSRELTKSRMSVRRTEDGLCGLPNRFESCLQSRGSSNNVLITALFACGTPKHVPSVGFVVPKRWRFSDLVDYDSYTHFLIGS